MISEKGPAMISSGKIGGCVDATVVTDDWTTVIVFVGGLAVEEVGAPLTAHDGCASNWSMMPVTGGKVEVCL